MSIVKAIDLLLSDPQTPKTQLVKARKLLREKPEDIFKGIAVDTRDGRLDPYSEVCRTYVYGIIQENGGSALLDSCHRLVNTAPNMEAGLGYIMVLLQWLSYWSDLSSQILKRIGTDSRAKSQLSILLHILVSYDCQVEVVLRTERNNREVFVTHPDKGLEKYVWQVDSSKYQIASQLVKEVELVAKPQSEIKQRYRSQAPINDSIIFSLWEMIVEHAALALRQEGDFIVFKDPDLTLMGLRGFLVKQKVWPKVEVVLLMNSFGVEFEVPAKMEEGFIVDCEAWGLGYRSYLNLALLAGIRHIVGDDRLPNNGYKTGFSNNGNGHCLDVRKRRPPRAHCQRLPEGKKASDRAAAGCLQVFGRPLAPGKTFHRQGEGEVIVRPSTEVTANCIEKLIRALAL